jgi:hypothetical protein
MFLKVIRVVSFNVRCVDKADDVKSTAAIKFLIQNLLNHILQGGYKTRNVYENNKS